MASRPGATSSPGDRCPRPGYGFHEFRGTGVGTIHLEMRRPVPFLGIPLGRWGKVPPSLMLAPYVGAVAIRGREAPGERRALSLRRRSARSRSSNSSVSTSRAASAMGAGDSAWTSRAISGPFCEIVVLVQGNNVTILRSDTHLGVTGMPGRRPRNSLPPQPRAALRNAPSIAPGRVDRSNPEQARRVAPP